MKSRGGDPRWIDSDVRLGNAESDLAKAKATQSYLGVDVITKF